MGVELVVVVGELLLVEVLLVELEVLLVLVLLIEVDCLVPEGHGVPLYETVPEELTHL